MFCGTRAFRPGESGRLSLDFVVACAAAGVVVLHRVAVPMRLNPAVVLCVPEGESRRAPHSGKRKRAALTAGKSLHTPKFSRRSSADIISASTYLRPFPN